MKIRNFSLVVAAGLALCCALPMAAKATDELTGDAITKGLLKKPEFTQVALSPDGTKLAIARRVDNKVMVTVHNLADMAPLNSFDPGYGGEITDLAWMDDERLVVGATRLDSLGYANFSPVLVIATLDGKRPKELPWGFFSVIQGDKENLLVHGCKDGPGNNGCNMPQIRRAKWDSPNKKGEVVIEGPPDTSLVLNKSASAGFAVKWDEKDGTGTVFAYKPSDKTWTEINNGATSGLEIVPVAVTKDGKTGYLKSERKEGPDVVEAYDFATGQRTVLYTDPHSDPFGGVYALDSAELLGAHYEPTDPQLHLWSTSHPDAQLHTELQAAFPGQDVDILSHSRDNNLFVLGLSSDRDPGTWYLFDRKARKAKPLAREYPWLEPKAQGPQSAFELKARDGLLLHGVLTLPPGSDGKNLPLVVVPHGGPFGILDHKGFDAENQILAQHGYAVLQVNFRGSGGYGRAFERLGMKQWGRTMQDDLTDATRWAIAQGIADGKRVCIFGMSYGGYAALEGPIREPDLYKCAADYAGPSELAKITRWDSDHRSNLMETWFAKWVGTGAEVADVSPALHADKFKVPLLLAHGYLDQRVGVRHAQTMHKQLHEKGVPVDYIEYSDTGHQLWVVAKHREDFYTRLLRLLDQNIGPEPKLHADGAKSE